MFRHVNLIQDLAVYGAPDLEDVGVGESTDNGGEKSRQGEPANYPDREADGPNSAIPKYIVWAHGFKVNGQQARGWHAEMFKRLYWAGSTARFVGVSWFGFETPKPDYHSNVDNAFVTAGVFGPRLKKMVGNYPVTLVVHSLCNMLFSSYLSDHHEKLPGEQRPNVVNYLIIGGFNSPLLAARFSKGCKLLIPRCLRRGSSLLNAAVALEAYLGDQQDPSAKYSPDNPMVHSIWHGYQQRLGASEWYRLFDDNDAQKVTDQRETLTWRNRFENLPLNIGYYSFYSTGEDVLATFAGDGPSWEQLKKRDWGRNSWVIQEKWKGRAPVGVNGFGGTTVMGWGFNPTDYYPYMPLESDTATWRAQKKNNANTQIMDSGLIAKPFFRKPSSFNGLSTLFDPVIGGPGSDYAANHRDWLLAEAFPALTLPTGGSDGERMEIERFVDFGNSLDMNANKNGWPSERTKQGDTDWWHSDIKDVAFPFTYKVFIELLQKGGLQ